jgi:hypothetical protein
VKAFSDKYQPLAKDLFGLSSLWLGEDHLVYVKGSGFLLPFTEEYKRFRLSEIQAVNVAKTSRTGWILLYLFGLLLASLVVTLILVLADSMSPITVIGLSLGFAFGFISLGLLARHLILGPTCICDIQTRLSRERIRPLNRYHRTLEMVRRIDGLVRDRQSDVRIGAESDGRQSSTGAASARAADFFQVSRVVPISFGAFLVLGLGGLLGLHFESLGLTAFVLFMILAASLVLLLALIAVVRKPTPDSLRTVLWLLLGLHFLIIGIGTVYYLVVATREPAYTVGLTGPLEAYAAIPSEGGMALYGVFVGLLGAMTGASITGLLLAGRWRTKIRIAANLAEPSANPASPPDEA